MAPKIILVMLNFQVWKPETEDLKVYLKFACLVSFEFLSQDLWTCSNSVHLKL